MPRFLLVLNAGSSSVKFSVFETDGTLALRWRGQIEGFGASPVFEISENGAPVISRPFETGSAQSPHKAAFAALFDWLFGVIERNALIAAGHRVVHGGGVFTEPVVIDEATLARIDSFSPLAPLHQPHNVAGISAVADLVPGLMQVACFDTAFHRTIPAEAYTLALPKALRDTGLRRYGFHGLSYENIVERLTEHLEPDQTKVIAAHLGNGASLCAIENGKSIETTMGFTALDGLVMGTRAGLLDPGVVLHLVQAYNLSARELETLLYKRCGLLGLSGETNDMRALLDSGAPEAEARRRLLRLPGGAGNRRIDRCAWRSRCARIHGGHRRAIGGNQAADLRAARLAGRRARSRCQCRTSSEDQRAGQPGRRAHHPCR